MPETDRILVTGSAGCVGQAVVAELRARGHAIRGFDLRPTPGVAESLIGDIKNPADLRAAVADVRTVIHLAACPDDNEARNNFLEELLPNNIKAVYHVLEAARAAGVRRMMLASSGQVHSDRMLYGPWPIRPDEPLTPRYWYAATKAFLEAAAYGFAMEHRIQMIVVRLGWCPRPDQEKSFTGSGFGPDVWLSRRDCGRFFGCAVTARLDRLYTALAVTSRAVRHQRHDLSPARELFGFEPLDRWDVDGPREHPDWFPQAAGG